MSLSRFQVGYRVIVQDEEAGKHRPAFGNEWIEAESAEEALEEVQKMASKEYYKIIKFEFLQADEIEKIVE